MDNFVGYCIPRAILAGRGLKSQLAISLLRLSGSGGSFRYATLSHKGVIIVVNATMIITVV
jgi:hypothetical protein